MLQRLKPRPLRILMTVDAVGGVWQYALGLARQLTRAGDMIVLAGLGPPPTTEQRRQAEGIASVFWLKTPPDWMAADRKELDGLPEELADLASGHAADLVHLNAPAQAAGLSLPCPIVAMSHSCVVTWLHTVYGTVPSADWAWQKDCNRAGFERADIVLAPSQSHAAALTECYGPVPRLRVVHNGVTETACRAERETFVLAAGRWWDPGKNGGTLDAAASRTAWPVFAAGPTTGPSGDGMSFQHAVSLGSVPNTETRHLMARCGIFTSPSLYEPFGLAALEAAKAGTPLVLADIPTYRELWDDAALFFPPRDAGALADAVNRLAKSPFTRRKLGAAALRRSYRYTMARQAAATRSAYDEALSVRAQRR
jgi:glycosyltransferase involved in cell wall biosynthesis